MADDSDDSDEWGKEELDLPTPTPQQTEAEDEEDGLANSNDDTKDDDWLTAAAPPPPPAKPATTKKEKPPSSKSSNDDDDRPMIIVDMTKLTQNKIHSKFDRNSVNDSTAASSLRKNIERDYEGYSNNAQLLQDGIVIPCGVSVWRDALSRLRDERAGHYFAPIFPPSKK